MKFRDVVSKLPARERLILSVAGLVAAAVALEPLLAQGLTSRFAGPYNSQPLALTANSQLLVAVNPDNNSVSFFDLRNDRNRKIAEVPVQQEPNGVAFLPDGSKVYVANTVSGTISVIPVNAGNGAIGRPSAHVPVGTEPYGLALTPNGRKLYVTNSRSNSVSIIDTATDTVTKTIQNVGFEPRGLAISNDGDGDDNDETIYVTQFLSLPAAGKLDGSDDSKIGYMSIIDSATDTLKKQVPLQPVANTGFNASGDALKRIPPGPSDDFVTGAYANQLNSLAIKGAWLYLPNTGASPNGPVRFDNNTQSLLHVVNRGTEVDANKTVNMHSAVADLPEPRTFITVPWAIAFKNDANEGYVVSAASNLLVKLSIDLATGQATVNKDPFKLDSILQIPTGKNPRGIVINWNDTRAYVMNYISRNITVVDLTGPREAVLATISSAAMPVAGSTADKIHTGKELYNTSIGDFTNPVNGNPLTRRMSNNGWGSCSSCHPFGLSDNVVWLFDAGPRRTIPQHTDFDQSDPTRSQMRMLNWSANRDDQEDFERNIRDVSAGQGIIVLADGQTPDPNVANLRPLSSANRNQILSRGFKAWDALKAYIQFGIRAPISPVSKTEPDVITGEALFKSANCQSCHGGASWTSSRVRFMPPPAASQIVAGQVIEELRKVGTFDPTVANEVRQTVVVPPNGPDGFVPPSLLSIGAFPQTFFHNGIATSLTQVMDNVTHRAAGTSGVDTLANPADRNKLIRFLESIDASTPPIPIP